jgi:transposase
VKWKPLLAPPLVVALAVTALPFLLEDERARLNAELTEEQALWQQLHALEARAEADDGKDEVTRKRLLAEAAGVKKRILEKQQAARERTVPRWLLRFLLGG